LYILFCFSGVRFYGATVGYRHTVYANIQSVSVCKKQYVYLLSSEMLNPHHYALSPHGEGFMH